MKAAVCRAFGEPLVIEEVTLDAPGPDEVLVDIRACAICHSDIYYAEGAWGGELPAVYGHEAAGIVRQAGASVSTLAPGDHVIVTLIRACGHCHYCRQDAPVLCEGQFTGAGRIRGADGSPYLKAMATGAFAQQVLVHHSQLVRIAPDIPFDVASLLGCGVLTGFGAVTNTAALKPGQSAAVIGCGGVGLSAIQAAAINGAEPLVALDISDAKLAAARMFGATHAINAASAGVPAAIMRLTGGRGVDFVFVAAGSKAAFDLAPQCITRRGAIVLVGMPADGVMSEYDPGRMASMSQRILGSKMGDARIARDIPHLIELYRAGRLKLDELISGRYPLESINEAMAGVNSGGALRNVLMIGQG